MTGALDDRRIWLARPAGQAGALANALRVAGAQVLHVPALTIEPLAADEPASVSADQLLADPGRFDAIVFVSTNAVAFAMERIERLCGHLPPGPVCYAVGAATARALARHGIDPCAAGGAMDTDALLQLPALRDGAGQQVLIVRGIGGRRRLGDVLSSRGAQVRYAEIYRRGMPAALPATLVAELAGRHIDLIVAASGETVENIVRLGAGSGAAVVDTALLVPGERVAALARRLGFGRVIVAHNAATPAMLAAVTAALGTGETEGPDRG